MIVCRSFDEIVYNPDTVLTVGTFDGVHSGHGIILNRLVQLAKEDRCRSVLATIDPHPRIVLGKDKDNPVQLLTTIEERIPLFESYGLDNLVVIPFTKAFAAIPPEVFVRDYLAGRIGMKKMLVGYDHMFGKNREGNKDLLDNLGRELAFEVEQIKAYKESDITVSSTKIRNNLLSGKIEIANQLLGYDYFVVGNVIRGDQRGRSIGFPTANIQLADEHKLMPSSGVYLVSSIIDDKKYHGMANIGTRPTFTDDTAMSTEVHFFDFNENLYDSKLSLSFIKYIRPEQKFASKEEFILQLEKDKNNCEITINSF